MCKQSARSKFSTLQQICKYIPPHLVAKLARTHGVDEQARTFSPWSHVVALLYVQLSHAIGLNNVCDGLRMHKGKLAAIRGATPPARNTLSHANKIRSAKVAEELFWEVLEHLTTICTSTVGASKPSSGKSKKPCNCAIFWATAETRFSGTCGWRCWSTFSCVSWRA